MKLRASPPGIARVVRVAARLVVTTLAVAAALAAASLPAAAAATAPTDRRDAYPFATLKNERPARRGPALPPTPFDCSAAEVVVVTADSEPSTHRGDTFGASNQVSGYGCVAWDESGGEKIFRLDVPMGQDVQVRAALDSLVADLDLFLLSDCDGEACLAYSNQEMSVDLSGGGAPPGRSYWLLIDGYQGAAGPYKLTLTCRYPGVPPEICDPGSDIALPVPNILSGPSFEGQLPGPEENRIEAYSCSPFIEKAGEVWYAVTLPDSQVLTATVTAVYFDAALWLFDGCGLDPSCLAFADDHLLGEDETLTYGNYSGQNLVVYLAVDGFRPPASPLESAFSLTITGSFEGLAPAICQPDSGIATSLAVEPGEVVLEEGTIFGRTNYLQAFWCSPNDLQRAGEAWYALTVPAGLELTASVSAAGFDAALWLMDGCGPAPDCLAFADDQPFGGDETFAYVNDQSGPQTVFLAVDAGLPPAEDYQGNFSLRITGSQVGLPSSICDPGGSIAIPLECAVGDTTFSGSLFGLDNLVQSFACSPEPQNSGEAWFALTLPPGLAVIAQVQAPGAPPLDTALWLFDACGPETQCLRFSDAEPAGGTERLIYRNGTEQSVTVYFAIDAGEAPSSTEAGVFDLGISCTDLVPAERASLGRLKTLYR